MPIATIIESKKIRNLTRWKVREKTLKGYKVKDKIILWEENLWQLSHPKYFRFSQELSPWKLIAVVVLFCVRMPMCCNLYYITDLI